MHATTVLEEVENVNTSKHKTPEIIGKMAENLAKKIDRTEIQGKSSKKAEKLLGRSPRAMARGPFWAGTAWESCRN